MAMPKERLRSLLVLSTKIPANEIERGMAMPKERLRSLHVLSTKIPANEMSVILLTHLNHTTYFITKIYICQDVLML